MIIFKDNISSFFKKEVKPIVVTYDDNNTADTESNWKVEYADPQKLKMSMLGMSSEGNSVAGMISNGEYGAMVHKQNKKSESNWR